MKTTIICLFFFFSMYVAGNLPKESHEKNVYVDLSVEAKIELYVQLLDLLSHDQEVIKSINLYIKNLFDKGDKETLCLLKEAILESDCDLEDVVIEKTLLRIDSFLMYL